MLLGVADVHPGMLVKGTVTAVEAYGALVQLADGVRGLCQLAHMSEAKISKPPQKFQVCLHSLPVSPSLSCSQQLHQQSALSTVTFILV